MNDLLLLQERVRNTIQLGESHFREFKSALAGKPSQKKPRPAKEICKDIAEALIAFANADGGELLVGVEDDGAISGVQHNEAEIDRKSWEQLRPFLARKTALNADAKFEPEYLYPEWACREAMINAIAHRDYSIQNGVEIFIFDDRFEFKSPGALLSTLTLEALRELEGAHESRNVLIAKVLRENKYVRELGEGFKRIFQLLEQHQLPKPVLYSNTLWFSLSFRQKA